MLHSSDCSGDSESVHSLGLVGGVGHLGDPTVSVDRCVSVVLYDSVTSDKLEVAWQALQCNEPGAHDAAQQIDIGGGRHVDLVRSRQVVTAEPHRTRRVFRRHNGVP